MLELTGFSPLNAYRAARGLPNFLRTLKDYSSAEAPQGFKITKASFFPILTDFRDKAGNVDCHYFHQDLWAARKIHAARPARHLDIGSRVDGFVAHVLTFMPITLIDVRPLPSFVDGLTFIQEDATRLTSLADGSVESLSSLHAVEHFGLGRYGDPVDPYACFHVMKAMARVLKPSGRLYFSVPIGRERLEFNAQRVFSPQTILDGFAALKLVSFAAVNDRGDFDAVSPPDAHADADYACGLFELTK
ncbi:MAG: DUF268 domain-containing protein [Deltaproteobacteria bacterium]|nr:DUF268 domain-containing protein [Deltaproteobacteria bacterium]